MSRPGPLPCIRALCLIVAVLGGPQPGHAEIRVTIERNEGPAATGAFTFASVPPPARDDAAARARVELVRGWVDRDSGGLVTLTDGVVPGFWDDPGANFFFRGATTGGCFRLDLGEVKEVTQVNTYSWHHKTRGPQVYTLHGSDGRGPDFQLSPKGGTDPAAVGWRLIATVDTRPKNAALGGQYGVSVSDSDGRLGEFRFLLLCCMATEFDDDFGNTFYSEVDVLTR